MNNSSNVRYILYARKSTESSERQVQSLADQQQIMSNLAINRGINIVKVITESKSAKTPNSRDGFNQMIKVINKGKADGIITYAFDRLSRNPVDSANIKWMLQTEKIKRIITQSKDYLPEDNALLLSIEDGMANEYIRKLSRDVKRGMVSKFDKGIYPNSAPIGYYNCPFDRDIKVDKKYFPIIRKMWDMLLSGKYNVPTIHKIAFEDWKLRTPKKRNSGGKLVSRSLIYKIFHNPFYMGVIKWDGMTNQGIHKPMITPAEFELAQTIINRPFKHKFKKYNYSYTGLISCANCTCQITAETKFKNNKPYSYYFCTGRSKYIKCDQKSKRISLNDLESQIKQILNSITIEPHYYEQAIITITKTQEKRLKKKEAVNQQKLSALSNAEKKKERLTDFLINGVLAPDIYKEKMNEVSLEIAKLKLNLANSKTKKDNDIEIFIRAFDFMKNARNVFEKSDSYMKKDIFKSLGSKYELKDRKLNLELTPWFKRVAEFKGDQLQQKIASEPVKHSAEQENLDFSEFCSRWCTVVNLICNDIENHTGQVFFPSLNHKNTPPPLKTKTN